MLLLVLGRGDVHEFPKKHQGSDPSLKEGREERESESFGWLEERERERGGVRRVGRVDRWSAAGLATHGE